MDGEGWAGRGKSRRHRASDGDVLTIKLWIFTRRWPGASAPYLEKKQSRYTDARR